LNLTFKRPHLETREAMIRALKDKKLYPGTHPRIIDAQDKIKDFTGHKYARVVNSGNAAIMIAMNSLEDPFLIPDQGAWSGFLKLARFLKKEVIELKTDKGYLSLDLMEESLSKINTKPGALFITSFAGYTAEQPLKELFDFCNSNEIKLVEDASGGVGDPEARLGNGEHAHVIVASTGSPKMVNVGSGGFISTSQQDILDKSGILLRTMGCSPVTGAGIAREIDFSSASLIKTTGAVEYLKKKIGNVLHPDKRGINVIIPCQNPPETARGLRKSLNAEKKSIITTCPLYDRVLDRAICVEIKNLALESLNENNLQELMEILSERI